MRKIAGTRGEKIKRKKKKRKEAEEKKEEEEKMKNEDGSPSSGDNAFISRPPGHVVCAEEGEVYVGGI